MGRIKRRDLLKGGSAMLVGTLLQNKPKANIQARGYQTLECKNIEKVMDGTRVRMRSFNGQVPGPLIKTKPGDTLRIRVRNSLPPYDSRGWNGDHNVPHDLNTTNLHLHGLDIRPHLFQPVGTSNPLSRMIAIEPGEQYDYTLTVPDDHPPGLYWYHPHHHGSTAVQATSGMAGPVIVYGNVDEVPEVKAARDIPLVIQDLVLFPSETEADLWLYEPKQNTIWQTFGGNVTIYNPKTGQRDPTRCKGGFTTGDSALHYFLLNGEPFFKETHNNDSPQAPNTRQLPVTRVTVAPGDVVGFRLLIGCGDNLMPIIVEGHTVYLLAMDGVNYPAPRAVPAQPEGTSTPQMLLAPANRAEFMIKASATPGIYRIVQLAQNQQFIQSAQKVVAEIEVKGAPKNMQLPQTLPTPSRYYPLIQASEVKRVRTLVFSGLLNGPMNPYVGLDFTINESLYQETAVPQVVELDTVEEWHIKVGNAHHGGSEGHPFHIHVNHFEVISVGDTQMPAGTIQDTIWVPTKSTAVLRSRFKTWAGKAVYHCHILPHEDTGMMGNFLILPKAPGDGHGGSGGGRRHA
jgi:suppressor of ftsI